MGKRVHVISKQVEYGSTGVFSWKNEEFKDLLRNCGAEVCESGECSDDFELLLKDYERAQTILKRMKENPDLTNDDLVDLNEVNEDGIEVFDVEWKIDIDGIKKAIKNIGYDMDELIECLDAFYNERDKNGDWIQFAAF